MAADEPPYLTVGTDVSAKYKGAFCEAKIKKVARVVKCKVTFKNAQGTAVVPDEHITGTLRVGAHVEAKHPDKNQVLEAVINKLIDYSQYTVVFDDGDETTLRRTSLCLKSGRHFAESESLDQLPLTNPEHFGTPVIGSKTRRKRNSVVCAAAFFSKRDDDSSEEDLPLPKRQPKERRRKESSASTASSASKNVDLGRVVCVEQGTPRGNKKENWFPALIVSPSAQENLRIKFDHLVRSFKDGKYFQVPKKDTKEFTRAMAAKVESPALKAAVEKALTFMDKDELPTNWDRDTLMGLNQQSEDSHDSDSDTSDDEPSEEKDRFVAQLYKFMDERGTPINRAPSVGSRDLNLYKLFKIVQKIGGYNRVTNLNQWKNVFLRLGLSNYSTTSSYQTKQAYKKYLHSFEDFFRKLGCTMVSNTRGRYRTDRNLMMTRNRERDMSATRGKSFSKSSKKEDEKRKSRIKDEIGEESPVIASTSGVVTSVAIKEPSPSCSSSSSSIGIVEDAKIKREVSPTNIVTEEKTPQKDNNPITTCSPKKKDVKPKPEPRKSFSQDVALSVESSDDDVPLSREGSVKLEKEVDNPPVKKEKVKRKDSRDESGNKKVKKTISVETKDDKIKSNAPILEKKPKKEIKKMDSKDSTTFHERKSGESDVDSSDTESTKIEKAQGRKYSDGAIGEWNKGPDSAPKKPKKKKTKEGGPDGDGDDDNDGQETDLEEFTLRTGGINIGDKIRVKYGHGGQHKIYEAKVLKIDEKLPKPFYVHYTGWNMRYDEWIRRSRIVENVSSSSVGKKKKSATTPKLPGQSKGPGKRGRPSLASVHSDSGSSTQSTSLSPASSRKTASPTSSSRSRQTRSDKTSLASGLEPKKRGRSKSGTTGEARDSDNDESIISDNEDDISDKSINDKDEENSPEDMDDEPKIPETYAEPLFLPRPPVDSCVVSNNVNVPDVLNIKVESDDDQELLMRNEDNKDPLPIKIEEILDMISPLSEDDLPKSFTPHLDINSPKDCSVSSPVTDNHPPVISMKHQSKEIVPIIVRRKSQEQEKEPILVQEETKPTLKDISFNLSSATDVNCSLDEDTESEDEALINLCVPKKDETTAKDIVNNPIEPVTDDKEVPPSISSFEIKPSSKPEIDIIAVSETFLTFPTPITVTFKEETKANKEVIISPPIPIDTTPTSIQVKPLAVPFLLPQSSIEPLKVIETLSPITATDSVIPSPELEKDIEVKENLKLDENTSGKTSIIVEEPAIPIPVEFKKTEEVVTEVVVEEEEEDEYKFVDETEDKEEAERLKAGFSPKKEFKKKRKALKQDATAKEDIKIKPKKKKIDIMAEEISKDHKAKKIKKSKVKKRNEKSESSDANSDGKKTLGNTAESTKTNLLGEKKKKEKKKKEEKKVSAKTEVFDSISPETSLSEFLKKKKTKKNKDKLVEKKTTTDFILLEKKPKKKKKQITVDEETEGDKSNSEMDKLKMVKKKKRKSKLKDNAPSTSAVVKDLIIPPCINLTEAKEPTKKEKKNKQEALVIPLTVTVKEEVETEETEREMSFLLCEEKVPASPVALDPCPEKEDNDEENNFLNATKLKSFTKITSALSPSTTSSAFTAPNENASTTGLIFSHYTSPTASIPSNNIVGESSASINTAPSSTNRLEPEITAVLDNTPPTTPESSGSLLSSTPPHEDERPVEFKLIRNPTIEVPECDDTSSRSTDSSSASTTSSGGLTGLSTLGPDFPKPSYMSKRPKMDLDRHYEVLPAKRRRKSGKASESPKAAAKAIIAGRPIKVERDADVTSPNASPIKTMECSYSDSLFIDTSPPSTILPSALTLPSLSTASTTIPNIPIRPNRPSKFNFDDPLDENADTNKRITVLQERMTELRKTYMSLKAEVALIDRRRKKAKKKDKNSGASAISTSKDSSNQGNGNSGSSPSLIQMSEAQTS